MEASTGPEREDRESRAEQDEGWVPADIFANRLKLVRGEMSIREAADACGLGRGAWTNWERGARPQDLLDAVAKISGKLGCSYKWLLFGGPLLPTRGKPVKRTGDITLKYLDPPVCTTPCRPSGRSRKGVVAQVVRRPKRVNRTQMPTAA